MLIFKLFSFTVAGKVVASVVNFPCPDIRSGSMVEGLLLKDSGDQTLELSAVSGARMLLAIDIGGVADHGCWEDLDFVSELVELSIIDEDKGDCGDVALLERARTYVHFVLCDLAPTIHTKEKVRLRMMTPDPRKGRNQDPSVKGDDPIEAD